jgi:hypothetical protein
MKTRLANCTEELRRGKEKSFYLDKRQKGELDASGSYL